MRGCRRGQGSRLSDDNVVMAGMNERWCWLEVEMMTMMEKIEMMMCEMMIFAMITIEMMN